MDMVNGKVEDLCSASVPNLPAQNGRPTSMVLKKRLTVIPAHLIAEAISSLQGLDLRWSGPITQTEMQYVQQYVLAKYPQYSNGLLNLQEPTTITSLQTPTINEDQSETHSPDPNKPTNPKPFSSDLDKTHLEPSPLLDALTNKSDFISIPEIQARIRALSQCGLQESDYLVLFVPSFRQSMAMVGDSYPFFKGNYYLTILDEQVDCLREHVTGKEAKVVVAPEEWLDLRIKGSKLSQHFRRKCKSVPKGLFSYPAVLQGGVRNSMHWISEAHRSSWHVLLDATGHVFGEERLNLALHRPDFVVCTLDNTHGRDGKVTCLMVRKSSFDAGTSA